MKVHVVFVEPADANSYIHDVHASRETAREEAAEIDAAHPNVSATARPFTVDDLNEQEKQVHQQNSDGTAGLTVTQDVQGPNGEKIKPGDIIRYIVTGVEKRGGQ